jgi:hypothetical protein
MWTSSGLMRTYGTEHINLFVANLVGGERNRRLHSDQAENLEQMILNHVTQGTGLIVILLLAPQLRPPQPR